MQETKHRLSARRQAYLQVFDPKSLFVKALLKDLAKFCRANASTYDVDHRTHALLEGRREVWLRILQHTKLTDDQLWELLR